MSIKDKYKVISIKPSLCKEWLLYKHYAHRIPSISYAFGLYDNENNLQGVCTYGLPASNELRETCGIENRDLLFELNRLIKNDNLEKNVQSFFVSQTFRLLPKPLIIVSYSDPNNGHNGYTYQSLNFLYTGTGGDKVKCYFRGNEIHTRHIKDYWFNSYGFDYDGDKTIMQNFRGVGGTVINIEPKHRYFYFLGNKQQVREMKSNLKYPVLPYPKGENKRYDASYQTTNQETLFV